VPKEFPVPKYFREMQKQRPKKARAYTSKQILVDYKTGKRCFDFANLDGEVLALSDLRGATFRNASMRYVNLAGSLLIDTDFGSADLTGASLEMAYAAGARFFDTNFTDACLKSSNFMRSDFVRTIFANSDMKFSSLRYASFTTANLEGARMTGVKLDGTVFIDTDVRALCSAHRVTHYSPSSFDPRTILNSYTHPGLQQLLVDSGVPQIFATYMIECARAIGEPLLNKLMQSTFISYGGPDECFVRRIYDILRVNEVTTFFFPETAHVGARISDEIFNQIQRHDRVLLVCSKSSLKRPGVIHEIQETLDREARDGGATYLLPIMLDNYVLTGWRKIQPSLAERIGSRVIADFRRTRHDEAAFNTAMSRLIDALKIKRPMNNMP
jgi:TIR domain/Pentapeptide repeats (8 copies)